MATGRYTHSATEPDAGATVKQAGEMALRPGCGRPCSPAATMSNGPTQKSAGKKRRDCPALGRTISSAECGSQRGDKITCPATCPYYPLGVAGHGLYARLDEEWSVKALGLVMPRMGTEPLQAIVKQQALPVADADTRLSSGIQQVLLVKLFLERDAAGHALADGWEDQPLSELNNDERVMTRHRRHGRVTVIEVQRIADGVSFMAQDLFEPDRPPFLVVEPVTAGRAVRFTRLLGWLTHYPGAARLSLPAFELPHAVYADWEARARAEFAQAQTETPGLLWKDFLSLRFGRCAALLHTVMDEQAARLRARTDLNRCLAAYALKVPGAEIEAVLQGKPEFRPDREATADPSAAPHVRYVWLRLGESAALEKELEGLVHMDASVEGVGTVGTVRIYADHLIIETLSKVKHDFARRMLEQYLGDKILFDEEAIEDLLRGDPERRRQEATVDAAQRVLFEGQPSAPAPASSAQTGGEVASEPEEPADAARRETIRQQHERHYAGFLDQPIDLLEGKTPRVAAADPTLRPRLIEIMKSHLHGIARRNQEEGVELGIDGILETLNLAELK